MKILRKNNVFLKCSIFPDAVILAPHLDPMGPSWCHLWSLMAPYKAILGPSWAPLVSSWSLLGPSWDVLEPPCGPLGAPCCHPGTTWAIWSPPGVHMGTISPHFGSILDSFWDRFGLIFWHFKINLHRAKQIDIIQNYESSKNGTVIKIESNHPKSNGWFPRLVIGQVEYPDCDGWLHRLVIGQVG